MTVYHPCKNCKLEKLACTRRDGVKLAIKGLGVSTIKFRCPERQPIYSPGDRVSVLWRWYDENVDGFTTGRFFSIQFKGTVSQEKYPKFIVRYDDADGVTNHGEELPAKSHFRNEALYATTRPVDMTLIAEPKREICRDCLLGPCLFDKSYPSSTPHCLSQKAKTGAA